MEIFINEDKLNFQLENEKNLKEIIENVNDWLFKNMKVVDDIVIDGKVFTGEIQNLMEYTIKNVKKLDLTVVDINQLVNNSLSETKSYLTEISKYLNSKEDFTSEDIERLISGVSWTINILMRVNKIYNYEKVFTSKQFNFNTEIKELERSKEKIEQLQSAKKTDKITEILKNDLVTQLSKWVENINILLENNKNSVNSLDSVREKVSDQVFKIINKIPDMQKLIEMTVMDMQTGHEKEAMTNIQIIMGTLESIFALLQLIKSTFSLDYNQIKYNKDSIESFNKNITELLKEIVQAIEIKDTVLISDLLNYELGPKLEQYGEILKVLATEVNIEVN
ncbi:MAG: hypothetical protein KKH98_09845 [Spirochaetes bacterium]|nr:hypothetical protein [Spirochaetota bacterium]